MEEQLAHPMGLTGFQRQSRGQQIRPPCFQRYATRRAFHKACAGENVIHPGKGRHGLIQLPILMERGQAVVQQRYGQRAFRLPHMGRMKNIHDDFSIFPLKNA